MRNIAGTYTADHATGIIKVIMENYIAQVKKQMNENNEYRIEGMELQNLSESDVGNEYLRGENI